MKRNITAFAIIALGAALFIGNTNAFGARELLSTWWPVGLIIAAGLILMNNPRNYVWTIFIALMGVVILMNNLNLTDIKIGQMILPAIVVVLGLSMLLSGSRNRRNTDKSDEDVSAFWSGTSIHNNSSDYTSSRVTSVMGGVELDLSRATIKKEASINVFVMMGGVEVRVPDNVIVKNRATLFLGGIEDNTRPEEGKNSPILYIDGSIVMGGVEIKR